MIEHRFRRFGLRDFAAVLILAVLLVLMGIPTLAQSRRLNRREACALNLRTIGFGAKFYANDNGERWMVPPYDQSLVDNGGIDYLAGDRVNVPATDPGEVASKSRMISLGGFR